MYIYICTNVYLRVGGRLLQVAVESSSHRHASSAGGPVSEPEQVGTPVLPLEVGRIGFPKS